MTHHLVRWLVGQSYPINQHATLSQTSFMLKVTVLTCQRWPNLRTQKHPCKKTGSFTLPCKGPPGDIKANELSAVSCLNNVVRDYFIRENRKQKASLLICIIVWMLHQPVWKKRTWQTDETWVTKWPNPTPMIPMDSQGFHLSIFPVSGRIMRPLGRWAISRTFAYQILNVTSSSSLCLDSYLFACSLSAAAGSGAFILILIRAAGPQWKRVPRGRHVPSKRWKSSPVGPVRQQKMAGLSGYTRAKR